MRFCSALLVAICFSTVSPQRFEFFPGGTYDGAVPTPQSILGYEVGSYHTDYAGLERWLDALRKSDRVRVLRYGATEEKRPLYLIVVTSPANLAKLDAVRDAMAKLADPRTTNDGEAARIAASVPAVAWMNHGNDGNESAAFESAIQTSYQLAGGTDDTTTLILDNLVTIINPAAIFVGIIFWSWVWGVWGLILAVPMLMMTKAVCDRIEELQPIGELLGE